MLVIFLGGINGVSLRWLQVAWYVHTELGEVWRWDSSNIKSSTSKSGRLLCWYYLVKEFMNNAAEVASYFMT
jgi:hypothetical protein